MRKKHFIFGFIFFITLTLFLSINPQKTYAEGRKYKVGTDLTFAPFEFQNDKGEYIGIDIDLLNAIAINQNFTIDLKPLGFNSSVQAVQSGQVNGMIAGMSVTEERKKSFDFSDSYFTGGISMAVRKDNTDIKSYTDLKGKVVAVKTGTVSANYVDKIKDTYGFTVKSFDSADALYDVINVGGADAIFDDYPIIDYSITKGKPLKRVGDIQERCEYAFAVKKGTNKELLHMFNYGLKELKNTGEYDKIINKYTSTTPISSNDNPIDESTFVGLIKNNYKALLSGLEKTLTLTLISFGFAMILGIIFGLFSVSPLKPLRMLSAFYVDVVRGIPLLVLAFFIFFGIPNITGKPMNEYVAGVITLTLNASAYIAEIVRGGVGAVPIGQMEAARSLGFSYTKTMRKIVLPQAIKIMIPSFVNQFVISLKDTTILSAIGLIELLQTSKIIVARTLQSSQVYLITAVIYLVIITLLTKLAKVLERRFR